MERAFANVSRGPRQLALGAMPIVESLTADRWVRIVILAAGYSLTGIVGLSLAIPPGYATAVWPPSGIALAAILMWGPRVWPGIAIGSVLVNLGVAFTTASAEFTLMSVVIALSIAAGSTIQALVCAGATRRWVGVAKVFETGPATLAFTGIAVVSCLIASSWGVATLSVAGLLAASNFLASSADLVARRPDRRDRLRAGLPDMAPVAADRPQTLANRRVDRFVRIARRDDHNRLRGARAGPGRAEPLDLPAAPLPRVDRVPLPAERRRPRRVPPFRDRGRRDRERHRPVRRRKDDRLVADAASLRRPDGRDGLQSPPQSRAIGNTSTNSRASASRWSSSL